MKKELLLRKSKWISGEDMETGALVIVHTEEPVFLVKINPDLEGEMLLEDTLQFYKEGNISDQKKQLALQEAKTAVLKGIISKAVRREYKVRMDSQKEQ